MSLNPGTRLGHYEVVAALGAGGMGEVYRARDTRLGRSVAIKVLRGGLDRDGELRARFRREAEAIAALKHPHICVLYDIGEDDGDDYLVMEHLEGETLAQRLTRGPLPLEETIERGIEIASALAAAHRQGIVHRDLKPGNVMLTASGAKVLDFGLAKSMPRDRPLLESGAATEMAPVTVEGAIVGTLGYMAPEQLEGRQTDERTDLFAMGAILYETATGKRAFEASSQAGLIAAVLGAPADASAIERAGAPQLLGKIVLRCLAKDPEQRMQSAVDLIEALRWVRDSATPGDTLSSEPAQLVTHTRKVARYRLAVLVASTLAVAAIALYASQALRSRVAPTERQPRRLSIVSPSDTKFTPGSTRGEAQFALSPDGSRIAFIANRRGERGQIWIRSLASGGAAPIAGTDGAASPFWSPDGQSLGFFARGKLRTVTADGASIQDLADTTAEHSGGTWSRDGVILFNVGNMSEIQRVEADGGTPEPATRFDPGRLDRGHRYPQFLPDGRHFLFHLFSERREESGIYLGSLDSNEVTGLAASAFAGLYAEPGYLLIADAGQLAAQRFDLEAGTIMGTPLRLPDKLLAEPATGLLALSVASGGTLAYWQGRRMSTEMVWLDRSGRGLGRLNPPERAVSFALSPDGRQIAIMRAAQGSDVWRLDLERELLSRVTFTGRAYFPIWSSDGQSLMFVQGPNGLVRRAASGAGSDEVVNGTHLGETPEDWSRDGRWLLYTETGATGWDMGAIDLENGERTKLADAPAQEAYPRLSPNGRWLAYASNESGAFEIYVLPFPAGDGRWQVTSSGGSQPAWSPDGKELFYVDPRGYLVAVTVEPSASFT